MLGGGLTGLSAGYLLAQAGFGVRVFEGDSTVGGLSKTIVHEGFRFDLGGHRFFTRNKAVDDFVRSLMGDELVSVPRKSKIYMRKRYFDYPLKPINALFGLGIPATAKIISDYGVERVKRFVKAKADVSLEDWVVGNFGRKMFDIYFKEYSEKVWGIKCSMISADWVAQRIKGLSLAKAVKNAFFRLHGNNLPTLVDGFLYPELGIGRISDRLRDEIEERNEVVTATRVVRVQHSNSRIESVTVNSGRGPDVVHGEEIISSMPITSLVRMLRPAAPARVLEAADKLRFRDLVVVALMVNRKRVTDQTWIYIPERNIPFGRIHEPTNWSEKMAPEGKTLLVVEFFSFRGDEIWNETDEGLVRTTVRHLENLGFVSRNDVVGGVVQRVPRAYPLFEVGYKETCGELYEYLRGFKNLHIAGRGGMFRYYNMDHAIESGFATADRIIRTNGNAVRQGVDACCKENEDVASGDEVSLH